MELVNYQIIVFVILVSLVQVVQMFQFQYQIKLIKFKILQMLMIEYFLSFFFLSFFHSKIINLFNFFLKIKNKKVILQETLINDLKNKSMSTNQTIETNKQLINLLGDTISLLSTNDSQASLSTIKNVFFSFFFLVYFKKKNSLEIKFFN